MSLQFCQVVKWVRTAQFRRMNETHVQITYLSTIHRFIEEGVFSMQNRFLQCPLDQVVVQGCTWNGDIVLLLVKTLKTLAG
jgi:hypothetical protein